MAPLTFADTHNMIAFLTKSDASEGFDQIVDFLNAHTIQYALMVNLPIYVSCIKHFWASVLVKKTNDVVKLQALIDRKKVVVTEDTIRQDLRLDDADGVECLPNEEIFAELARIGYEKPPPKLTFYKAMVRNVDSPSKFLMYPRFLQGMINAQVDDLSSHTTKYTSFALTQKVFANIRRIEDDDDEVSAAPTPPSPTPTTIPTSPTHKPLPPLQEPIPSPLQPQLVPSSSPPQEQPTQPTHTSESSMTLFNTLMETCATLTHKVAHLEQDKGSMEEDVTAVKKINAAEPEPIVFNNEKVTMTMAQTLIKIKAEKARILDEQMAKRLQDEEIEQAAAMEKQDKEDLERAKVLQQQYDQKQENIDWNVVVEQMKNMIVYLNNMAGYKTAHFKGMTYDQVSPIFEREYNKVQTFLKPDRDEEPAKKRVAEETLLQENFKKLRAEVEVSGSHSTQDTPIYDPKEMSEEDVKNMLQIVPVAEFKVEALQVKYPLIDWEIYSEGSRTYWKIIRVGGITQAYQSFEDMLKHFDREDLDVMWRLTKEKFVSLKKSNKNVVGSKNVIDLLVNVSLAYKNVSQDIRDQLDAEAEAVQIILTGIDNDIYSTVDACPNACEMWKAIERFYKMMNELIRNQCDVTNHQVNVQFLLQLQLEWQRFVTLVKQSQDLKTVSYHKLYDILKQHQNEVNEIRAERTARKSIVNSPTPIYDQEPSMVAEDDEMSKDNEIDKLMALISLSFKKIYTPTNNNLRTSSNTSRANQDKSPRINKGAGYDNQRLGNVARAKETIGGSWNQLNAEQAYWRDDTDDESKDQELEAHYIEQIDQNDDDNDLANERELLASLIEELICEIDDNKNCNNFWKHQTRF
nr:hypothetical protein [Tanacetum cinerariifolium]